MTTAPIVGTHRMTPRESHLLEVDLTANLGVSETLSAAGARLTDRSTGTATTPTATISGKKIQATVSGLTANKTYHVELYATGSGGNIWAGIIEVTCVE
jgi:hypothetical protein